MCNDYSMRIPWKPSTRVLLLSYLTLLAVPTTILITSLLGQGKATDTPPSSPSPSPIYGSTIESRLSAIERSNMKVEAQQSVIFDQLKMVLEVRRQVIIDSESLHNVVETLKKHEDRDSTGPGEIAELRTKVNWLLIGLGGLVTGTINWMFRQAKSNSNIATALHNYHQLLADRHKQVDDKLDAIACIQGINGVSKIPDDTEEL